MSEIATEVAPVESAPAQPAGEGARAAFAARTPVDAPATPAEAAPAPTEVTPPVEAAKAPDYGDFVKELGYESPDALKARLEATKDFDPKAVEGLRANQRDDHDKAVRDMLADPVKARAYFELQTLQPDALAAGSPEQQRSLLFEKFKLDNPRYSPERAAVEFEDEFDNKYALADGDNDEDPAVRRAKLRFKDDLADAVPAVKAAQTAAKVAALPKPAEAEGPTPEQRAAATAEWLKGVDAALTTPIEQTVQVDGKPVKVAYDGKDAGLKEMLAEPEQFFQNLIVKTAYPNGFDKAPDLAALAQVYGRLMQPDAIAKAAAEATRASIGAHVPLSTLANPAPDAPQPLAGSPGSAREAFRAAVPAR